MCIVFSFSKKKKKDGQCGIPGGCEVWSSAQFRGGICRTMSNSKTFRNFGFFFPFHYVFFLLPCLMLHSNPATEPSSALFVWAQRDRTFDLFLLMRSSTHGALIGAVPYLSFFLAPSTFMLLIGPLSELFSLFFWTYSPFFLLSKHPSVHLFTWQCPAAATSAEGPVCPQQFWTHVMTLRCSFHTEVFVFCLFPLPTLLRKLKKKWLI